MLDGVQGDGQDQKLGTGSKTVTRRQFLRLAGIAGATIGVGGGLSGLVAACGGATGTTTSSAAATTTTSAATTTTAAATPSTTVTASAEQGREVKIGVVSPKTGALATYGMGEDWSTGLAIKVLGPGAVLGDGKLHKISFVLRDSQSDSNRASQVAQDLITSDKVDLLVASGTPENVNPAAVQAEALGCPFLSNYNIWQSFIGNDGKLQEFKWVYGSYFGFEQVPAVELQVAPKMNTNKKVGLFFANDIDGNIWHAGEPPAYKAAGYEVTDPGQYQQGTEDFTNYISKFKSAGCEIILSTPVPPDLVNFWTQGIQQGFRPKMIWIGKAMVSMTVPASVGDTAVGWFGACAWHPTWPWADALTGMTGVELRDDYEKKTGQQWGNHQGMHAKITWAVDVLKRTKDVENKQTIVDAIKTTKMDLITGPMDFTSPIDPNGMHISPNFHKQGWAGVQVTKGADARPESRPQWPMEITVVGAVDCPGLQVFDPVKTV